MQQLRHITHPFFLIMFYSNFPTDMLYLKKCSDSEDRKTAPLNRHLLSLKKELIILPGFTTHYLFGVKAFNDLPNNYLKHVISKYRWLYQLGLQGPDIFFYNVPILRHRDYRNVGSYMHEYHVNDFFRNYLNELAEITSKQQREQASAYFAGFICHYIADSICHPFVYGRIQYETDGKGSRFHGLHAELENDIDMLLLRKFKNKKPSEFNQAATICLNGQEIQFISHFLSSCINATYYKISEKNSFQVSDGMVFRSIYAIRFGGRLLSDPAGKKRDALKVFEFFFLPHPIASKKVVTDAAPVQVRRTLNMNHEVWTNPWNKGLASTASFPDLYRQTLQKCNFVYYHLNSILSSDIPIKEQNIEHFLGELGNYSYHSGLDVG